MQTYAFIISENTSYVPLISIVSSLLAIANASVMISYDKDVDPTCRANVPSFYGAIPAAGRGMVFFSMFVFSSCHVLMKVLSTALLASVGGVYVGAYLGGDMLFYFIFKTVRGDFRYWVNVPAALSAIVSSVIRVAMKLMVDFTCLLQGRHSFEEGGLYFCISILISHASCFVAAYLYIKDRASSASLQQEKFGAVELWAVLSGVEGLFLLSFTFFLLKINRKYVKTFFSTMTGKQFCVVNFHNATNDVSKIEVFDQHPSYYASIRDEVKTWVGENWERWSQEKPAWFTARVISTIPDDMIPTTALNKLKMGGRRRSSAGELLLGAPANTVARGGDV